MKTLLAKLFSLLAGGGHGFIPEDRKPDDWTFGAIGGEVIRPDGQWLDFLPTKETQKKRLETMNCTSFGTLNAIETLHKALYDEEVNYSDRFHGIVAGTTVRGNRVNAPCETIRKLGNIPESKLPFSDEIKSWSGYYSPKPMSQALLGLGKEWLDQYEFLHEWVRPDHASLKSALRYSPLGVDVDAWARNSEGLYFKRKASNHWTCLVGYEEGKHWLVFDSYSPHLKKLAWNTTFSFVKRYYLKRTKSKLEMDQKFYDSLIGQRVMRVHANGELYKVEKDILKKIVFNISDDTIWKELHKVLREKKLILGVSEPDFLRLSRVAKELKGGIIEANAEIELASFFKVD